MIRENFFIINNLLLTNILTFFKLNCLYQFKILTCISGIDYPENFYRFQIVYEFLSIKYNSRIRFKFLINELTPLNSIEKIFPAAS